MKKRDAASRNMSVPADLGELQAQFEQAKRAHNKTTEKLRAAQDAASETESQLRRADVALRNGIMAVFDGNREA